MRLIIGVLACVSVGVPALSLADPPASPPPSQSSALAPTGTQAPASTANAAAAGEVAAQSDQYPRPLSHRCELRLA